MERWKEGGRTIWCCDMLPRTEVVRDSLTRGSAARQRAKNGDITKERFFLKLPGVQGPFLLHLLKL